MEGFSFSGCCCCPVYSDTFGGSDLDGWTEDAGSWSEGSGVASTSSTTAVLSCDTEHLDGDVRIIATVTTASGNYARLILGFVDTDNYFYAEFRFHASTGQILIVERSGGSDTTLATKTNVAYGASSDLTFEHRSGMFVATGGDDCITSDDSDNEPSNGVTALGTGGTVASAVDFDDVEITKMRDGCASATCPVVCSNCSSSEAPLQWLVKIVGVANDDSDECVDFYSGTYLLRQNSACTWNCNSVNEGSGLLGVGLEVVVESGDYILRVTASEQVMGSPQPTTWTKNYSTTQPGCTSLECEELTLEASASTECDHSGTTVYVSAVTTGYCCGNAQPCYSNSQPQKLQLTIAGLEGGTGCSDANCESLDGTYILDLVKAGPVYSACYYFVALDPTVCGFDGLIVGGGGTQDPSFTISGSRASAGTFFSGSSFRCLNFSDLALSPQVDPSDKCDSTNATCTITAIGNYNPTLDSCA